MNTILTVTSALTRLVIFVMLPGRLVEAIKSRQKLNRNDQWVDGIVSLLGIAPYDTSKFALEALADALRVKLSFWDVKVAAINPSNMRTPLAIGYYELHHMAWQVMEKQDPARACK